MAFPPAREGISTEVCGLFAVVLAVGSGGPAALVVVYDTDSTCHQPACLCLVQPASLRPAAAKQLCGQGIGGVGINFQPPPAHAETALVPHWVAGRQSVRAIVQRQTGLQPLAGD